MEHVPNARRRIVMLVDNPVDGDSRVQKAARSMADVGWEVHLIGRSTGTEADDYRLGRAHVHRLPLQAVSPRKSLLDRVMRVRHPLACKSTAVANILQRDVAVSKTEELQRRHAPAARGGGGIPRLVRDLAGKVRRRFLMARVRQTKAGFTWRAQRTHGRIQRLDAALRQALHGTRAWRRLDPTPLRYDVSYAKLIDELRPDLVHAHDYRMIGVAARAVARARAAGREVRLVYDAHEFVPGMTNPAGHRWLVSQKLYEREYFRCADAVVTVSEPLADLLVEEHGLTERPAVVLNTPPRGAAATERASTDVRDACGLRADQPLAVYCGGASEQRSLHTLVGVLEHLPELHIALVINTLESDYVRRLRRIAREAGATDRLHLMGYVPYEELPDFLSTADVGVHPLRRGPINHEVALSTKFFEFMQAKIPVVVSDVRAMAEAVREIGIGEVFASENVGDLASALKSVLADPDRYRQPFSRAELLDQYTWEHQSKAYDAIYRRLLMPGFDAATADFTLKAGVDPYHRERALDLPADENGIQLYERDGERHRHPVQQTQYAISLLEEYAATESTDRLDAAAANARDLLETVTSDWILEYGFDFPLHGDHSNTIHAPWRSAMAQGQFLSLATRLWTATEDAYWRDVAERVFQTLLDEDADKWITFVDGDGYTWLEEYAGDVEPMRVLNGHVFAMYGLYDYWHATQSDDALVLFNKAAATVLHYVPWLRVPGGPSWYGMRIQDNPVAQSPKYHRIHVRQLEHLAHMTGGEQFRELAEILRADFS